LYRILGRVEIIGVENIPISGAYIVAQNHISTFDVPFVLVFWPNPLEVAGARAVWDRPGQSILARMYGGIKVHRGQYDRKLIDRILLALGSGYPLLIAPEGGRSRVPGMLRAKPGVAYLVDKAKVPVIPVGVYGSNETYLREAAKGKRPLMAMRIGKPVEYVSITTKGSERRNQLQKNADMIMREIARLLPEGYGGVYGDESDFSNYV
jgi:1-acyl-sn-glycerol-3-phosphate acyltransferase